MKPKLTPKQRALAALEDLVENAPLDFIGTGSHESGRREETEYNLRCEKVRRAIRRIRERT